MKIAIVTATTDPFKSAEFWETWRLGNNLPLVLVVNGVGSKFNAHEEKFLKDLGSHTDIREHDVVHMVDDYLGTVPAFAEGFRIAQEAGAQVICCFHDDVRINDRLWDMAVEGHFEDHPACYLAGFGGAMSVGEHGMYDKPFDPKSLARHDFGSSLEDAEIHGVRWKEARKVAVLDGFSQIFCLPKAIEGQDPPGNPFRTLADMGIIHHAYDVALGAMVRDANAETWFLPIECHHAGGRTAVGDAGYQEWAKTKHDLGDQGLWLAAHRIVYDQFRHVLPFSVEAPT